MSKRRRRTIKYLILILVCGAVFCGAVQPAYADVATDTLEVRVGYGGMALSEYVQAGKYHWRELRDKLEIHQEAYSYFQSTNRKEYTAIVDSAQGFYITDILNLANIYYGDIRSLRFYVEDHKGIRTSFDKSALFEPRYYYDDLAGNRTIVYDKKTVTEEKTETVHHDAEYRTETYTDEETGEEKTREVLVKDAWDEEVTTTVEKEVDDKSRIVEYRFDNAADHALQVQPMLAIEDNWAQFTEEFEHIGPDFTSMNPSSRFRLLFGQTSPTESLTSKSDKYVSCVYVTLQGSPKIGKMGKLKGKKGSHSVEMTVSADDTNIRDALSELMNINSTNTNVLVITGIEVIPDSKYNDLAKVRVNYKIVGKGEASITAGVGSESEPLATSESVSAGETSSGGNDNKKSDDGKKKDKNDKNDKKKSAAGSNDVKKGISNSQSPTGQSGSSAAGSGGSTGQTAPSAQPRAAQPQVKQPQTVKQQMKENKADKIDRESIDSTQQANKTLTYLLSDEAVKNLEKNMMNQPAVAPAAEDDIQEVKIEDRTEEKEKRKKQLLLLTGLGCLLIGSGGSLTELISFKIRLKGVRKQWS